MQATTTISCCSNVTPKTIFLIIKAGIYIVTTWNYLLRLKEGTHLLEVILEISDGFYLDG